MSEHSIKYCKKCDTWLVPDDFPKCSRNRDGRYGYCRKCSNKRNKTWRQDNKTKRTEYLATYRQLHLLEHRQYERKRTAQKLKTAVGAVDYNKILERDGYICHLCGEGVERSDLHFDHVIPLSKGGPHIEENIRVSHARCNLRKHDKIVEH